MSAKYIFLLLGTFLLVQCSYGKALTSSKESDESTTTKTIHSKSSEDSSEEQLDEDAKLILFVLGELSKMSDSTLETGEKLLNDVVAEASKIKEKSEGVSERIDEYSKLLKKLKTFKQDQEKLSEEEQMEEKFDAMVELSTLLDKSNVTALENPTSEDQLFSDLLNKHGLVELEKEFEDNFVKFSDKFVQQADLYWSSLSSEEQKNISKFEEWFHNYKAEQNVEKRIEMFENFFETLK